MKNFLTILCLGFSYLLMGQDWHSDFDSAVAQANKENKPIVLVFAGSDWCAPCIKLDRSIWSSSTFKQYAATNYVLYRADFPRKKKNQLSEHKLNQNKGLAEKYNSKGYFPLVVLLDKNETVLGKTGYKKASPQEYINLLNALLR